MSKSTTKSIIKDWLNDKLLNGRTIVKSHEFEIDLVSYGEIFWGVKKLPSAYSRAWRQIRSQQDYSDLNVTAIKQVKTKGKEGTWELITST